jgi:putative transposase
VVYALPVHVVVATTYRRGVFSERCVTVLRAAYETVCNGFGASLSDRDGEDDHIHLLVSYPPTIALSQLVNSLKGVSSRRLRAEDVPEVRTKLWGGHLWSPSYVAASCGGGPLDVIAAYIHARRD